MSVGQFARRVLGKNFQPIGKLYRAIFVDIARVGNFIVDHLPRNGRILDIGGGDGMIVNAILTRRPDLHVTMTDIAPKIGTFLDPKLLDRVDLYPRTSTKDLIGTGRSFDAITITDVLHHVPAEARPAFWLDLKEICQDTCCKLIVVKDVMPGTIRGLLSVLSDRYITGDRHVTLIPPDAMNSDIRQTFQNDIIDIFFGEPDRANYCLVIRLR